MKSWTAAMSVFRNWKRDIKLLLVPSDPEDDKNAIVEIRGGTGGDEAAIFAGDLYRMYVKYCESKGWKIAVSSFNEGAAGGYKEIIFTVTGEKVYGTLKYESEYTVCNVFQLLKRKGEYIRLLQQSLSFPKPMSLTWKSTKVKSNGILSVPEVRVDKM